MGHPLFRLINKKQRQRRILFRERWGTPPGFHREKTGMSVLLAVALLLPFSTASAQPPGGSADALSVVDQARSLLPEFRADTLLRIAQSSLIDEKSRKEELIEDSYWSATHAFLPYSERADGRADSVDTNAVRTNGLNTMTLQTRAVAAMLSLQRDKAFSLFEEIRRPEVPKADCSSIRTPDFLSYYQTATSLFGSFTSAERTQGKDIGFLRNILQTSSYPAQLPPAIEMIHALNLPTEARRDLLIVLAGKLDQIVDTDRDYSAAETALVSAMELLDKDFLVLQPALRTYIARHARATRCSDSIPKAGTLDTAVLAYNKLVLQWDPNGSRLEQISADEAKPTGDSGTYQQNLIGRSSRSLDITEALRWLTHGNREQDGKVVPWTLQERSTREWSIRFQEADKLVHELKEDDEESPEAFFCMKADSLNALARLAPPGPLRTRAFEEFRTFLENYYPSIENRNLWFTMLRHMLYTARFSSEPTEKGWILNQLEQSTNPTIALYARLERRLGAPSDSYPSQHVLSPKTAAKSEAP